MVLLHFTEIRHSAKSLIKSNFVGMIDANLEGNSKLDMVLTQQGINLSRSDINISLKYYNSIKSIKDY